MKTVSISETTLNAVIQYLASCPFLHVEQLIQAIRVDVNRSRQADIEKTEKKPEVEVTELEKK